MRLAAPSVPFPSLTPAGSIPTSIDAAGSVNQTVSNASKAPSASPSMQPPVRSATLSAALGMDGAASLNVYLGGKANKVPAAKKVAEEEDEFDVFST